MDYEVVSMNESSNNMQIAISRQNKTKAYMIKLGDYLRNANKEKPFAFVYIYDDKKAAAMYRNLDNLTPAQNRFYDRHFVGIFWKGAGQSRYDLTIMLHGLNGKKETIKYNREDDRKEPVVPAAKIQERAENVPSKVVLENPSPNPYDKKQEIPLSDSQISENAIEKSNVENNDDGDIASIIIVLFLSAWVVLLLKWKTNRYGVWFEFFVAVFMGIFGVQQFREKRYVLGVIYLFTIGGFYVGWGIDILRYFIAAVRNKPILPITQKNINKHSSFLPDNFEGMHTSKKMPLPVVNPIGLILKKGEICHFSTEASYVEVKNVVTGRNIGGGRQSATIFGIRFSTMGAHSQYERGNIALKTPGTFSITNQRVVFSAMKGAFNENISELVELTPFDDGIGFQFTKKYVLLMMDNASFALEIIKRLVSGDSVGTSY